MKTIFALAAALLCCEPAFAQSTYSNPYAPTTYKPQTYQYQPQTQGTREVQVEGYTRRNGTYVQPYERTAPDNTRTNNWSSKPNVNPYTGKAGTENPYASSYGH